MNENNTTYVLDTSAWLTLIEDEAGADVVQNILESANAAKPQFWVLSFGFWVLGFSVIKLLVFCDRKPGDKVLIQAM